jgi:hypothetical protein
MTVVDSVQYFTINMGKNAQAFFIEKPTNLSTFSKGSNIYVDANRDVLNNDKKIVAEINKTYNDLINKLSGITSGDKGQVQFEKELPSILTKFTLALKKLLTIITPTEFFQAEKVLKTLEGEIIVMAAAYQSTITSRAKFRIKYRDMSDEYFRYGTYLKSSRINFEPIIGNGGISSKLKLQYYMVEQKILIFSGEDEGFDYSMKNLCYSKVTDKLYSEFSKNPKNMEIKDSLLSKFQVKDIWFRMNIYNTSSAMSGCHAKYAAYIGILDKNGKTTYEKIYEEYGDSGKGVTSARILMVLRALMLTAN